VRVFQNMASWTLKVDFDGDVRRLPNWPHCLSNNAGPVDPSMQLIVEAVMQLYELTANGGHALVLSCKDEQGSCVILDDGILQEMLALAPQHADIFRLTASSQQQPGIRGEGIAEPLPTVEAADETPHVQRAMGSIQNLAGALAGRLNTVRGRASERASGLVEQWMDACVKVDNAASMRLANANEDIRAVGARAVETCTQACNAFREGHRGVQQVQEDMLNRAFGTDRDTATDPNAAPSSESGDSTAMKVATVAGAALGVAAACSAPALRVSRFAAVGLAAVAVARAAGHTSSSGTQNVPTQTCTVHPEEGRPTATTLGEDSPSKS